MLSACCHGHDNCHGRDSQGHEITHGQEYTTIIINNLHKDSFPASSSWQVDTNPNPFCEQFRKASETPCLISPRHGWLERFYEGEFDDTKTDAGRRSIPLDSHGILRGVLDAAWQRSRHRNPGDLVLTNAKGGPVNRRNLLRRQLKPIIRKLGLPASTDFRSFRTMHSSLMSSIGVRPEVTRDNMGHANIDVTQNVYNRTWWEERVEAVSMAAATVWREFLAQPVSATRM